MRVGFRSRAAGTEGWTLLLEGDRVVQALAPGAQAQWDILVDPAVLGTCEQPGADRATGGFARFLVRAFGPGSPLCSSGGLFRTELARRWRDFVDGRHVLDLGSGAPASGERPGWPSAARVTACDVFPSEADAYLQLRGQRIDIENGSIDCVVLLFVLEHAAGLSGLWDEVSRVLRPAGAVLAVTTHLPFERSGEHARLALGHVRDFSSVPRDEPVWLLGLNELVGDLRAAGLPPVEILGSRGEREMVFESLQVGRASDAEHLWLRLEKAG